MRVRRKTCIATNDNANEQENTMSKAIYSGWSQIDGNAGFAVTTNKTGISEEMPVKGA